MEDEAVEVTKFEADFREFLSDRFPLNRIERPENLFDYAYQMIFDYSQPDDMFTYYLDNKNHVNKDIKDYAKKEVRWILEKRETDETEESQSKMAKVWPPWPLFSSLTLGCYRTFLSRLNW